MKQGYLFLLFLLSTVGLVAQTADINQGCGPLSVSFAPPVGSATFFWNFGDGSTSMEENAQHIFVNPGIYEVEFQESINGPVIGTLIVTVFEKPVLQIAADPSSGCAPLAVAFENNSVVDAAINVSSYQWVFGDGTSPTSESMPSHTYTSEGDFTVSLALMTDVANCEVTEIFEDFITTSAAPDVTFTTSPSPPTVCEGPLTVTFNNNSSSTNGVGFSWDFGNGMTSNEVQPPAQTYTADGQYTVSLTATNSLGCSRTEDAEVSIGAPISEFIIPDTVCINLTNSIQNNSSAGAYLWNFGNQAIPSTSSAQNPTVRFVQEGPVTISLTVTTGACSSTTEQEIFVQNLEPNFTISPNGFCDRPTDVIFTPNIQEGVTYSWRDPNNVLFSEEQNPTLTVESLDNNPYFIREDTVFREITLIITSEAGCVFRSENFVKIFEPTAVFKVDKVDGCAPLTVNFRDSSLIQEEIVNWEWHFGTGDVVTTDELEIDYTYENAGDYQAFVIITNEFGCRDTSYLLPITVGDVLAPDFEVSANEVCPGDTIQLSPTISDPNIDEWHYETDNGRSFHCYDEDNTEWSFVTETGMMDVSLTVAYNGCFSTITKEEQILVKGPIARLEYSMDCATPHQFAFVDSSYEASTLTWYFGDSTQSNALNPIHDYDTIGAYMVYLEAENIDSGCPVSYDSTLVYVKDIKADFVLDSLLCKDQEYFLNANASQDVDADCWRGYTWFFTHNRPITTQSASIPFVFTTKGEQEVWLETTDINGCRDSSYFQVDVFEIEADFEMDLDRICFPTEVAFQDFSSADTTLSTWAWDFGDMGTSEAVNPTYTYNNNPGGPFILASLTVQDVLGCTALHLDTIYFYEPVSQISINEPATICEGESLEFTASDFTQEGSNLSFSWNFGNGETANTQTASTTFNEDGLQEVILNFEEVSTSCPGSTSVFVSVQSYPAAAFSSSLDGLDVICYPENAVFQDATTTDYPVDYAWDFGNGQTGVIANPSTAFGKGTFEVELITTTSNGCADTTYQSYTLVGPEGDFSLSAEEICFGDPITVMLQDTVDISSYTWDFNDGTTVEDIDPASHIYDFAGQQLVTLVLKSEDGACSLPLQKSFTIIQPLASFETENMQTEICVGNSLDFKNTSEFANTWLWDFDDGDTSVEESPTHLFDTPAVVAVSLEAIYNPLGCRDTMVQEFNILAAPNTTAIGDTICTASVASLSILNPSGTSQYNWQPANLLENMSGETVETVEITENTTFVLNEITENGCSNSDMVTVLVVPAITGESVELVACKNEPITLTVPDNEFYSYSWTPEAVLSCADCLSPAFNAVETQTIIATPMDVFGLGCTDTTFVFDVTVVGDDIEVPNVFTPNGDKANDVFNLVAKGGIENLTIHAFRVYNRFGQLVYENDTPEMGWDGTYKGKLAPSDVYVYYIEVSYLDCFRQLYKGDVTLVR